MKILFVGDYSGAHANLRDELIRRGHEVTLAGGGDGFKGFSSDICLSYQSGIKLGKKVEAAWKAYQLRKMKRYDIVQFINPNPISIYYTPAEIRDLVVSARLSVVLLCGCDGSFHQNYGKISPWLCRQCEEIDNNGRICYLKSNRAYLEYEKEFYRNINLMIPMDWCYYEMHNTDWEREKSTDLLPMPIVIGEEPYMEIPDKLRILHPLNRKGFKGTPVIREAFIELQRRYGDRAEFVIDGRMPYKEYVELSKSADIILDQTYSTSAGMSVLLGMEQGKITMGGVKEHAIVNAQIQRHKELPLLSLGDNVADIVSNISRVLEMEKKELLAVKRNSRNYVKKYHDVRKVVDTLLAYYAKGLADKGEAIM